MAALEWIDVITLFPQMIKPPLESSIVGRAQTRGLVHIDVCNLRDHGIGDHQQVDDYPYGGGPGMVLKPEPVSRAVDAVSRSSSSTRVVLMTPQGQPLTQRLCREFIQSRQIVIICGHYEGIDERIRTQRVTDEVSIGDYVLTGGELPALVLIDSLVRLIPGVLGDEQSSQQDSFTDERLEGPQFTRPSEFEGQTVPEVLLSGDHRRIEQWRRCQALIRTLKRRPDLLSARTLAEDEIRLCKDILRQCPEWIDRVVEERDRYLLRAARLENLLSGLQDDRTP